MLYPIINTLLMYFGYEFHYERRGTPWLQKVYRMMDTIEKVGSQSFANWMQPSDFASLYSLCIMLVVTSNILHTSK